MFHIDLTTSAGIFTALFHISNLMAFLAFLLRDQLQLRMLMAVSLFMQGLYYYAIPAGPLYDPLFWKVVSLLANFLMIVLVFGGKLDFGIPQDLRGLFEKISVLTPGQFRKLIAIATRTTGTGEAILISGTVPTHLHYLLRGRAEIKKFDQIADIETGAFLGEIAFLNGGAATASVVLPQGSECLSWEQVQLKKLMQSDKTIDIALRGIFIHDLADKVAKSMPLPTAATRDSP